MTIPIWSSFAGKERVVQAELTRDRAATALEQLTEAATIEYRAAVSEYTSALEQREQARRGLDLATRILDRTRVLHRGPVQQLRPDPGPEPARQRARQPHPGHPPLAQRPPPSPTLPQRLIP